VFERKTVAAHTLGCKVNQHETETILELFRQQGYQVVDFAGEADVYLINTCTVTHLGDRKSRQIIRRATRQNPHALVVVTGCYAQRAPEEIAELPGVDLIVGNQERGQIVGLVEKLAGKKGNIEKHPSDLEANQPLARTPVKLVNNMQLVRSFEELPLVITRGRTRAMVKVEDGCNQYCSYCIVPYTRGPVRSRPAERVVAEIAQLVEAGFQEIVLTGIHTSAYGLEWRQGKTTPNLATLIELILREVPSLARLRISSVEPTEVPEGLSEIMANSRVLCRHLHIPLQSGDDEILQRMRRPYSTAQYAALVRNLRDQIPGLAITTDVMVGFPGETDAHFARSCSFIKQIGFSDLHVFKYSPRKGTPAAAFKEQVVPPIKEKRSQFLITLAAALQQRYAAEFLGESLEVLLEEEVQVPPRLRLTIEGSLTKHKVPGACHGESAPEEQPQPNENTPNDQPGKYWAGYSDNYLRVTVPVLGNDSMAGRFVKVSLMTIDNEFLLGRIIENSRN
jgi:threonylcarbamoyladenosine tRNA methylthiotransferase MtaB